MHGVGPLKNNQLSMKYRKAQQSDIERIESLLSLANLHKDDVIETIDKCVVATLEREIIGTAALECIGDNALLKSFAVHPDHRKKNIGKAIFRELLPVAYKNQVNRLFLLTTTAEPYFLKLNFKKCNRASVPDAIAQTHEFISLCPTTAICMSLDLDELMHYYSKTV